MNRNDKPLNRNDKPIPRYPNSDEALPGHVGAPARPASGVGETRVRPTPGQTAHLATAEKTHAVIAPRKEPIPMTDLTNFASDPSQNPGSGKRKEFTEEQIAFLTALKAQRLRIPYAGLSLLRIPEATNGLNRGRHGSGIVKSLPLNLQPVVCRADGTYHEKAVEAFKGIENFDEEFEGLAEWKIIPQAKVLEAMASIS